MEPSSSIPAKTSRYARSSHADCIMPAGTYCLSLEPRPKCDPNYYRLGYLPLAPLNKVKQTRKGRHGKYGPGKRRGERYCVACYETMLEVYQRRRLEITPTTVLLPGHPVVEIMYHIDCEERKIEGCPWLGPMDRSIHYGIELFKARWLWHRRAANPVYTPKNTPHHPDFLNFIPGRDPKSIYIGSDAKEYQGSFKDCTTAEISCDEVDNCSLSEALKRLVRRHLAHEQENHERDMLTSYGAYVDDDQLKDPSDFGPASPRRVNPQVPVVRTTQDPARVRGGKSGRLAALRPAFSAAVAEPSRTSERRNSQMSWCLGVVMIPPHGD